MSKLIITAIVIVAVLLLLRWYQTENPEERRRRLTQTALIVGAGLMIGLAITGKLHWIFALVGAALPLLRRGLGLLRTFQSLKSVGQQFTRMRPFAKKWTLHNGQPTIETAWLRVAINPLSGILVGAVLSGKFRGSQLEQLDLAALQELLAETRSADPESGQLLETYLDQRFKTQWRQNQQQSHAGYSPSGKMARDEALAILGLEANANPEQVRDAHRRLMQKLHPDRGGSNYLAAKINQAKDTLLGP